MYFQTGGMLRRNDQRTRSCSLKVTEKASCLALHVWHRCSSVSHACDCFPPLPSLANSPCRMRCLLAHNPNRSPCEQIGAEHRLRIACARGPKRSVTSPSHAKYRSETKLGPRQGEPSQWQISTDQRDQLFPDRMVVLRSPWKGARSWAGWITGQMIVVGWPPALNWLTAATEPCTRRLSVHPRSRAGWTAVARAREEGSGRLADWKSSALADVAFETEMSSCQLRSLLVAGEWADTEEPVVEQVLFEASVPALERSAIGAL